MKKLCIAMMLAFMLCQPAMAETNYNVCFNSLDGDYDGVMTKTEFLVAFPDGDTAVFEASDSNKDGGVSHEEWEDYKESKGFEETH